MGRWQDRLFLVPGIGHELAEGHIGDLAAPIDIVLPWRVEPDGGSIPDHKNGEQDDGDRPRAGHHTASS
ncbi:hypothetical protein D3C72_2434220 [compost metagenome]